MPMRKSSMGEKQNSSYPSAEVRFKHFDADQVRTVSFGDDNPEKMTGEERTLYSKTDRQLNVSESDFKYETQLSRYVHEFVSMEEGVFRI